MTYKKIGLVVSIIMCWDKYARSNIVFFSIKFICLV